jgi:hydroxymethylpyrimidine/phosphomethylpyrimidine kinase
VIVVDPVLRASAGGELYAGSIEAYKKLLTKAFAVTPNVREAEALTGIKIRSFRDSMEAAKKLSEMGPRLVVVTGGHLEKLVDVIYYEGEFELVSGTKKLPVHGSGSFMAMALTSYLALGYEPKRAARIAIGFTRLAHAFALELEGGRVPEPFVQLRYNAIRHCMYEEYKYFIEWLTSLPYEKAKRIAPEVGINVAYSVPKPLVRGKGSVLGVPGRLRLTPQGLRYCCCPWWGAADHTARLLMEAQKYKPEIRAVMNVKYTEENVRKLVEAGFNVYELERESEPPGWESMRWAVRKAYEDTGSVPDVIYDKGFYGKEAMIRLLAKDLEGLKRMVSTLIAD